MDSVGRLAGGIAHDFNNMLSVILGCSQILLEDVDESHPFHADLAAILGAAQRSASLTRRLLALARRQVVAPRVLDLNDTVASMRKMLQTLLGEAVTLCWRPTEGVWPVLVDPAQLDHVLANLCANARDAIAGVGKVTIETENRTFEEKDCAAHAELVPGDYVRISVTDDGAGMDEHTLGHVFEPFFTTKAAGKGTGLGLATVYGAVKQNHGFIDVESAQGKGTTFSIFLPRHTLQSESSTGPEGAASARSRGQETILVVEDEPAVLTMLTSLLERLGYAVLPAGSAHEAVRLAREHRGALDLLLTDVVMPEMSGFELAETVTSLRPNVKRLYMSGYAPDRIADQGVLAEGRQFLHKPISRESLAAKVRDALEGD
jgi:CheY-like chemotaxis protein